MRIALNCKSRKATLTQCKNKLTEPHLVNLSSPVNESMSAELSQPKVFLGACVPVSWQSGLSYPSVSECSPGSLSAVTWPCRGSVSSVWGCFQPWWSRTGTDPLWEDTSVPAVLTFAARGSTYRDKAFGKVQSACLFSHSVSWFESSGWSLTRLNPNVVFFSFHAWTQLIWFRFEHVNFHLQNWQTHRCMTKKHPTT